MKRAVKFLAVLLCGCSNFDAAIQTFSPGAIEAGRAATLTLDTRHFLPLFDIDRGQLARNDGTLSVGEMNVPARRVGNERFEAALPPLPTGTYTLRLQLPDGRYGMSSELLQVIASDAGTALCGFSGTTCCSERRCNGWTECNTTGFCGVCGDRGQPPCTRRESPCKGNLSVDRESGLCE